ncbi:hypothetical protein DPMN_011962 [Dreissena polymorpha]|uniref:Uncharacterized protein n=1 Tax=Dreissena polymorpha TaxID=45954 RepID=A0A9D4S2B2_DREPO|nr:hypothetical protein DPMN_011962 [Dreissena polymorpha]
MAQIVLVVFEGTRRLVSSARLVGSSVARHRMELKPSGNGPPEKYVSLTQSRANTYNSQTHIHIYFWEYTSREIRVIDTITGNSQTHIHIYF